MLEKGQCSLLGQNMLEKGQCTWTEHVGERSVYLDRTCWRKPSATGQNMLEKGQCNWTEHVGERPVYLEHVGERSV